MYTYHACVHILFLCVCVLCVHTCVWCWVLIRGLKHAVKCSATPPTLHMPLHKYWDQGLFYPTTKSQQKVWAIALVKHTLIKFALQNI